MQVFFANQIYPSTLFFLFLSVFLNLFVFKTLFYSSFLVSCQISFSWIELSFKVGMLLTAPEKKTEIRNKIKAFFNLIKIIMFRLAMENFSTEHLFKEGLNFFWGPLFYLMGHLMTSFLLSTGRFSWLRDLEPGLISQFINKLQGSWLTFRLSPCERSE